MCNNDVTSNKHTILTIDMKNNPAFLFMSRTSKINPQHTEEPAVSRVQRMLGYGVGLKKRDISFGDILGHADFKGRRSLTWDTSPHHSP